jgi:hypothetical protein
MTEKGPVSIPEDLLRRSMLFAQSAVAAYSSEAWDVFYLHLATAVELLAKSLLASANPSFISDPRAGFDSLLHLSGFGSRAKVPENLAVRTISSSEALDRVGRLIDNYREPNVTLRALLDARNAIVHGGRGGKDEAAFVLGDVAQYLNQLLSSLEVSPSAFWGPSADLVGEHAGRRIGAIEAAYRRKLQVARGRYEQITRPMPEGSVAAFVAVVSAPSAVPPYEEVPVVCPACGNRASLTGTAGADDWGADYDVDGGEPYVDGVYVSKMTFGASSFRCGACGLQLESDELDAAELAHITVDPGEYDAGEAADFFGRVEEDRWD